MKTYEEMLDQLKSGEIQTLEIEKNDFLAFREVLIKRDDFKHFSGNAMQGAQVVFTYLKVPRS
ncbi:hypothetical protein ACFVR1_00885 [Psychrobacillus sp. NPDC058041]|uniref:hypothetical protein n=1 Tax=Psychrobacillus sp. NPDC058041 TaxID=3346310 RepID=UPI0036DE9F0F